MQFNVLGALTARSGAEALHLGGSKQRTVLAMLIGHVGRPVSADELIEAVYGDDATAGARRTIQTYVSNLRSAVGDTIKKTAGGWVLETDSVDIDAHRFEDLYESTKDLSEDSPEQAAEVLREALGLWRGHPYVDVEAHGYLDAETTRLNELRNAATAARIDADLALGRHAELIGEIDALLSEHPYQERFRAQHMLALYRSGRQKAALRSFAAMRELLVEELGVDPTPELQELEHRILEQDGTLKLAPPTTIQKRAVLVADAGNPIDLARLSSASLDDLLQRFAESVDATSAAEGADWTDVAGTAFYALFDAPAQAAAAAEAIALRHPGEDLRMAVDWGDVQVGDNAVSGPPVARAARLVAAAHAGQVLISPDAQQAMTGPSGRTGMRLEALGEYDLSGLVGGTVVYQLLIGSPPREFPALVTDRIPPPLPGVGRHGVPGYELREQIGHGSAGTMYRGYQPSVGREVVVEVIDRADSSDVSFIRRFEADAQRLSLLEHPNILPVLDYWRDTDGAAIVYPFHRGGGLDVAVGRVDAAEVVGRVGSALAYAHSCGLVHGTLASSRIVLDEGGHPYLYGFPIAGAATPDVSLSAYLAHEVLGAEASIAGDVFALGVLTYTMFAGSEPDPDTGLDLSVLHDKVRQVVATATAIDPAERYGSVEEFLTALLPIATDKAATRHTGARNPYKGLAAFQESDAGDFHGRTAVVEDLLEVLAVRRFLAVVGPSGIGKSSVVRAGLIPALRKGALPGSERWLITDMMPGSQPFREFERSLERVAVAIPNEMRERLIEQDPGVFELLESALPAKSKIVIVVDQFEELFTMADDDIAARFLDLLLEAAANERVNVVVTLRADFLGRPLRYSAFGELLRTGVVTLRSPNPQELAEAIDTPAAGVGVSIEPALTERIVTAVHDQPGALPLLQHALSELFVTRVSDLITVDDYDKVGGIRGSLARRAEKTYSDLEPRDRETAKQLFLHLVSIEDETRPSRRRVRESNLEYLASGPVIDAFTRRRLLVHDRDAVTRTPTVEVAHEALFTHWPRLAGWIADLTEDLVLRRRLAESVEEWEANARADAYLLTPARVTQHQEWTAGTELTLSEAESAFLETSSAWSEQQVARRRRRRRSILTGFATAAVIAAGFAIVAANNASRAEEQAELAQRNEAAATRNEELAHSRELAASAINVLEDDPELSVLLALQAADGADPPFESVAALHSALQSHRTVRTITWPEEWPMSFGLMGSISPDGRLLAVSGGLNQFAVWDLESGSEEPIWSFAVPSPDYVTIVPRFTTDGLRVVATVAWLSFEPEPPPDPIPETGIYVWHARTGEVLHHFRGPHCPPLNLVDTLGYYIDDQQLVGVGIPSSSDCSFTGTVDIWLMDLTTGEMVPGYEHEVFSYPFGTPANFSDDGRYFGFSDGASTSSVVDVETGETILEVPGSEGVKLSRDGSNVLASSKTAISLWDVETATQLWTTDSPVRLSAVVFNEEAGLVQAGTEDGSNRIWDAETGRLLYALEGHPEPSWFLSTTTDGQTLASFSMDRTVRIWDLTANAQGEIKGFDLPGWPLRHSGEVVGDRGAILHYPDATAATQGVAGTVAVFNISSGKVEDLFPGYGGQGVRLSPNGKLLVGQPFAAPGVLGPVHIRDVESGEVLVELEDLCGFDTEDGAPGPECAGDAGVRGDSIWWADFTPDGSTVAVGGAREGVAGVWDVGSGERLTWLEVGPLVGNDGVVVKFSPEADFLLTSTAELIVYETERWSEVAALPLGWSWLDLLFTPDGRYVIASDTSKGIVTIDTATWEFVGEPLPGHSGAPRTIDLSSDGSLIASGSGDGFVRVSSLATKDLIQAFSVGDTQITLVEFIDDQHLLVIGQGIPALVMTIDVPELTDIARSEVTRAFTSEECATYHIEPCPTLADIQTGS